MGTSRKPDRPALNRAHPLARGLVDAWPMVEARGISVGNLVRPVALTLGNAPTWGIEQFGRTLTFNGTNQYASTPTTVKLGGTQKLTIAFWWYWNAFANDEAVLLESSTNLIGNTGAFIIDPNSSTGNSFAVALWNTNTSIVTFTRPSAAVWHHVVVEMDTTRSAASGQFDVWFDGVKQSGSVATSGGGNPALGDFTWYFMSRAGTTQFGGGRLADVRVWTRLLDQTEINQLAGLRGNQWALYSIPRVAALPNFDHPGSVPSCTLGSLLPPDGTTALSPLTAVSGIWSPEPGFTINPASITVSVNGITYTPTISALSGGRYQFVIHPILFAGTVNNLESMCTATSVTETGDWTLSTRQKYTACIVDVEEQVRRGLATTINVDEIVSGAGIRTATLLNVDDTILAKTGGVQLSATLDVDYVVGLFARHRIAAIAARLGVQHQDRIPVAVEMEGLVRQRVPASVAVTGVRRHRVVAVATELGSKTTERVVSVAARLAKQAATRLGLGAALTPVLRKLGLEYSIRSAELHETHDNE